ncbi:MAG: hypothetical protein BWY72_00965 [Bacteroidetes bacterium ADurb.Bin416]|nr:MAG: hypothetical protein BWY72_00965 [Bacteroidetes bacterium ADurb.Bin416]
MVDVDENDAIGPLGSVYGRAVFNDRHLFNIIDIEVGQEVVVIAVVQHGSVILHIHEYPVDDNQRLCVGVQGVESVHEKDATNPW